MDPKSLSRRTFLGLGSLAFLDVLAHPKEALGLPTRPAARLPAAPADPKLALDNKLKGTTAALLVDAKTGEILYQKNADQALPPASTTKLMTALLVHEKIGLEGKVRVEKGDILPSEKDHIGLRPGMEISVKDLLYGLLVCSANDAARVLARHVAGSVPAFLEQMDARAKELGCQNSHFTTPNGMPAPGIQTTANDLLKIFNAANAVPALHEIMRTRSYTMESYGRGKLTIANHNKLLGKYPGMDAAKTGWYQNGPHGPKDGALHTFAASAVREGRELRLILLHSVNKWTAAPALFDYGFARIGVSAKTPPLELAHGKRSAAHAQHLAASAKEPPAPRR